MRERLSLASCRQLPAIGGLRECACVDFAQRCSAKVLPHRKARHEQIAAGWKPKSTIMAFRARPTSGCLFWGTAGGEGAPVPLRWLRTYQRRDLSGDLLAGLVVVGTVAPQAMAYAMLAGLPPKVVDASTPPLSLWAARQQPALCRPCSH